MSARQKLTDDDVAEIQGFLREQESIRIFLRNTVMQDLSITAGDTHKITLTIRPAISVRQVLEDRIVRINQVLKEWYDYDTGEDND